MPNDSDAMKTVWEAVLLMTRGETMSEPTIDMVLHCPKCGTQHIDEPEPENDWDNPPHKSTSVS